MQGNTILEFPESDTKYCNVKKIKQREEIYVDFSRIFYSNTDIYTTPLFLVW